MSAIEQASLDPLDFISVISEKKGWRLISSGEDDIVVDLCSPNFPSDLVVGWFRREHVLHVTIYLDLKISRKKNSRILRHMNEINQSLWIGGFGLCPRFNCPILSYSLILSQNEQDLETIENAIHVLSTEADRYAPLLHEIAYSDTTTLYDNRSQLLYPIGEA